MERKAYPTDVSDAEWAFVAVVLQKRVSDSKTLKKELFTQLLQKI